MEMRNKCFNQLRMFKKLFTETHKHIHLHRHTQPHTSTNTDIHKHTHTHTKKHTQNTTAMNWVFIQRWTNLLGRSWEFLRRFFRSISKDT